ncbi:MAG: enoyl-CoA hydratase-related protein, partial [Vicinamibacterales bacterium]
MATLLVSGGPVTTVTLNRPDVRNAFNEELIRDLSTWAASVPSDGSVRVVVLRGAGASFCAGADLQWMSRMAGYTREENLADARLAASM